MLKSYYVYMLRCADNTYYTGFTNNLERRLFEHHRGVNENSYTSSRKPLKLVWHERFDNPEVAIAFEKKIKKWSQAKKEALIAGDYDALPVLARKKKNKKT